MKKYFYIIALLVSFFSSCENQDFNAIQKTENDLNTKPVKVRGDNKYDMLGYAFDATGEYLDMSKVALKVIDVDSLQKNTGLIITDDAVRSETDIKAGSDLKEFLLKLNKKFSLSFPIPMTPFKGTVNNDINLNYTTTSKFSYARISMNNYVSHHAIKKYTEISLLQQYLSNEFKQDIISKTPEQIISLYGTHVYTDVYTGGSFVMMYRAHINNSKKELSAAYGASLAAKDASASPGYGFSSDTKLEYTEKSEYSQESSTYKTRGGTGATPIGQWRFGDAPVINLNQWSSTVSKNNAHSLQLIDVGDDSFIPIYEFVSDPTKKSALKTTITNYLNSNGVTILPVVPLYRYVENGNKTYNHHYTTNWDELGMGKNGWVCEGIEAFVFATQLSGTIPLYRFHRIQKIFLGKNRSDHYFTTDKASGGNYTYEGIACYVYPSNSLISGSVPLTQFWNSTKHDHLYTTTPDNTLLENLSGYGSRSNICKVYPGTRNSNSIE